MENLEATFVEFKKHVGNQVVYGNIDQFWEAWHKFTATTSHPKEVYDLATEDGTLGGEKARIEHNERVYQHRLAGRPRRRY
jgi:hypothetical protein